MNVPSYFSTFQLSPEDAKSIAEKYSTPLYVMDEAHLRERAREYQKGMALSHPKTQMSYASKANTALAIIQIIYQEGAFIDASSEGEARGAILAGVNPSKIHLHGNAKTLGSIRWALETGIGQIILDSISEIIRVVAIYSELAESGVKLTTTFALRLSPGIDPDTHEKISTGGADTKFGINVESSEALKAVKLAIASGLPFVGFHAHVGSMLTNSSNQRDSAIAIVHFANRVFLETGFVPKELNFGGGYAAKMKNSEDPMPLSEYIFSIISDSLKTAEFPVDDVLVLMEPGRGLVAEAGVTLYQVQSVKNVILTGNVIKTYVGVDGGLSDNPSPGLYEREFEVVSPRVSETKTVTISGAHCESDTLFPGTQVCSDLEPGDILQVLTTGAYNASMASNYNRFPRPAMLLLRMDGTEVLIQNRESWDEVFSREQLLPL